MEQIWITRQRLEFESLMLRLCPSPVTVIPFTRRINQNMAEETGDKTIHCICSKKMISIFWLGLESTPDSLIYISLISISISISNVYLYLCVHAKSLQKCPTLCNPIDHNPPGFSVWGIFQAKLPEWVAMPFPGDLPTQGSNSCLLNHLHWQASSLPLAPPGKPYSSSRTYENEKNRKRY